MMPMTPGGYIRPETPRAEDVTGVVMPGTPVPTMPFIPVSVAPAQRDRDLLDVYADAEEPAKKRLRVLLMHQLIREKELKAVRFPSVPAKVVCRDVIPFSEIYEQLQWNLVWKPNEPLAYSNPSEDQFPDKMYLTRPKPEFAYSFAQHMTQCLREDALVAQEWDRLQTLNMVFVPTLKSAVKQPRSDVSDESKSTGSHSTSTSPSLLGSPFSRDSNSSLPDNANDEWRVYSSVMDDEDTDKDGAAESASKKDEWVWNSKRSFSESDSYQAKHDGNGWSASHVSSVSSSSSSSGLGKGWRLSPGDWWCPKCSVWVYASRWYCFKCQYTKRHYDYVASEQDAQSYRWHSDWRNY